MLHGSLLLAFFDALLSPLQFFSDQAFEFCLDCKIRFSPFLVQANVASCELAKLSLVSLLHADRSINGLLSHLNIIFDDLHALQDCDIPFTKDFFEASERALELFCAVLLLLEREDSFNEAVDADVVRVLPLFQQLTARRSPDFELDFLLFDNLKLVGNRLVECFHHGFQSVAHLIKHRAVDLLAEMLLKRLHLGL